MKPAHKRRWVALLAILGQLLAQENNAAELLVTKQAR